jgi:uncharacterized damage-inducible protein DinB
MPRPHIDELVRILNRSFDDSEHSLLKNVAAVTEQEWDVLPEGGRRSIRTMVLHVGLFKFIYANHGFRDASMAYVDPPANPPKERLATPASAIEWLKEAHAYAIEAVDELSDDSELARPRKAHWGEMVPTLLLIDTMHEHDVYHAGEINKTRALLQDDDK